MMPSARVLLIDDEIDQAAGEVEGEGNLPGYMAYYIAALEENGFEVVPATGPDEGLAELDTGAFFDLVVLDVMMPPGRSFTPDETALGLRTGLVLAERIHKEHNDLPVVILSNAVPSQTAGPFERAYEDLLERGVVRQILFKPDNTPFELVERLKEVVNLGLLPFEPK